VQLEVIHRRNTALLFAMKALFRLLIFTASASLLGGCTENGKTVEARFELSKDSRLPSWYLPRKNTDRSAVDCNITLYTGGAVRFQITDNRSVESAYGLSKPHPIMKGMTYNTFPNYTIINVRGKSDVYEQRGPTHFLHITDDPRLTSVVEWSWTMTKATTAVWKESRPVREAIRRALLDERDPIGIGEDAEAQSEYDTYVPVIYRILISQGSRDELLAYLWSIETEHMGLVGDRQATEKFVDRLRNIIEQAGR